MAPIRRTRGGTIHVKLKTERQRIRSGGWLHGGLRLLGPVDFDVTDSKLPYDVFISAWVHEGRLSCQGLAVTQRTDGPPVTTDGLRAVTVDAYLDALRKELLSQGKYSILLLAPNKEGPVSIQPSSAEHWAKFDRAQRPRRPMDELLPQVADAYRAALRSPDPRVAKAPTAEVGRRLHYSRGHAARLVTEARREGLLDPARRGRPGEVRPAPAKRATKSTKKVTKKTTAKRAARPRKGSA